MRISELEAAFDAAYSSTTPHDVLHYMVRDPDNPSSIYACLRAARENARSVRGSLTTDLWETYNVTWLELQRLLREGKPERNPGEFFEWVKFRSQVARGVTVGTMMADESLCFQRLGIHLERADNTARLLDVKFHEQTRRRFSGGRTPSPGLYSQRVLSLVSHSGIGFCAGNLS